MQRLHTVFAITTLAAVAASQVNPFVFYPQDPERQTVTCTSYVGRPDMSNAAEALMEIDPAHFPGVGDAHHFSRFFGVYHWVADERLSTVETYDLVVRSAAAGPGPDMTPTGELLRIAGLTTPPSGNTQRGTWIMYDGFSITGGLLVNHTQPIEGYLPRTYVGVGLPANPLWPATDGHALFRADLLGANTSASHGENERAGAPNPTWAGLQGAPSFSTPWSYILGPFVTSPNLHMGGTDPRSSRLGAPGANLAMNGLFPDVSGSPRSDGLLVRVTDNLAPFGWCFTGASLGLQSPLFNWPMQGSLIGHSFLGARPISLEIATLTLGQHEYVVALPSTIPTALVGTHLAFQSIVWDQNSGPGNWTNAHAVHF
ncbi:MAG: hypothetical protein KDC98_14240 [Planctomycetes bacterium]|nr:hypothetical protein [Planctomycetota bacterium]